MARGGFRPGAGRPPGAGKASKQVKSAERALTEAKPASKRFKTALDFAMDAINDPTVDLNAKIRLAAAVLPFQHPKLESVVSGKKDQKAEAAKAVATGKFASPPAPPKLAIDNTK